MEIQVLIFPKPKLKETLEVAHENFRVWLKFLIWIFPRGVLSSHLIIIERKFEFYLFLYTVGSFFNLSFTCFLEALNKLKLLLDFCLPGFKLRMLLTSCLEIGGFDRHTQRSQEDRTANLVYSQRGLGHASCHTSRRNRPETDRFHLEHYASAWYKYRVCRRKW